MEEQRLYLHAAARGGRPRGYVQGRRRTVAVCGGGGAASACFGVSHRAWGGIGGGVIARGGGGEGCRQEILGQAAVGIRLWKVIQRENAGHPLFICVWNIYLSRGPFYNGAVSLLCPLKGADMLPWAPAVDLPWIIAGISLLGTLHSDPEACCFSASRER